MMHQQYAKGVVRWRLRKDPTQRVELGGRAVRSPSGAASAPPRTRQSAPAGRAGAERKGFTFTAWVAAQIITERFREVTPRVART